MQRLGLARIVQPVAGPREGGGRQISPNHLSFLARLCLLAAATMLLTTWAAMLWKTQVVMTDGSAELYDHAPVWAAAKQAIAGVPELAYDVQANHVAQDLGSEIGSKVGFLWLYPPHALLIVTPLGFLPYAASQIIFVGISLVLWAYAIWRPAGELRNGRKWMLCAPPLLLCAIPAQASLMWTAGLVLAIEALRARQALKAGAILAMMTMKPQIGLLIPVALVARGRWRVITVAAAVFAALVITSILTFGLPAWLAFPEGLETLSGMIERSEKLQIELLGFYPVLRQLGLDHELSVIVQPILAAPVAMAVFYIWRRGSGANFDVRAAGLISGSCLASPYAQFYESIALAVAAMYWARAVAVDGRVTGLPLMVILAGAGASAMRLYPTGFPISTVLTPLTILVLLDCVRRSRDPTGAFAAEQAEESARALLQPQVARGFRIGRPALAEPQLKDA